MITLDTSLAMSSSSFHYLLMKLRRKYGHYNKSIDQHTEAYAAKGVPQANHAKKAGEVTQVTDIEAKKALDYEALIEDLKLNLPENRFAILMMIPRSELLQIAELLGKEQLLSGLKFFTKEKLMALIGQLPKRDLLQMLFHLFTDKQQIIEHLPTKELHRFLSSDKIEKGHFLKIFEMLPRETLATIVGYLTGENWDKSAKADMLDRVKDFKKFQLVNGIKKLDERHLRELVTTMTEAYPKLYGEFSHLSLFNVADRFARGDLIESMIVVDSDKILDMLTELPDHLLALTISQIDPEIFAAVLLNNYQDLLAGLVLG